MIILEDKAGTPQAHTWRPRNPDRGDESVRVLLNLKNFLNSLDLIGRRACRRVGRGRPNLVGQAGTKGGHRLRTEVARDERTELPEPEEEAYQNFRAAWM